MGSNLVVAITDTEWFEVLRQKPPLEEVNFWAPSGQNFRALQPGELFLFKLHAPRNFIVGGGVFSYSSVLPCSLAWDAFGDGNGALSAKELHSRIAKYRKTSMDDKTDFVIGCRVLAKPFFVPESEWIEVPDSWAPSIMSFKKFDTNTTDGKYLLNFAENRGVAPTTFRGMSEPISRFGTPFSVRPRLGQGAFRVLVTDAYDRRCAVTDEKTLPALDAAHIQPYSEGGEHAADNGLLLRRDIHTLFDLGYVTVSPDFHFEVSKKIREEFEGGQHYYGFHGKQIRLPKVNQYRPAKRVLTWHNENCFRG